MDEYLFNLSPVAKPRIDLTGRVFGKLTVLKFSHRKGPSYYWLCRCECGKEKAVNSGSLKSGGSTTCGCGKFMPPSSYKHGLSRTKEYARAHSNAYNERNREEVNRKSRERFKRLRAERPESIAAWKRVLVSFQKPRSPGRDGH